MPKPVQPEFTPKQRGEMLTESYARALDLWDSWGQQKRRPGCDQVGDAAWKIGDGLLILGRDGRAYYLTLRSASQPFKSNYAMDTKYGD